MTEKLKAPGIDPSAVPASAQDLAKAFLGEVESFGFGDMSGWTVELVNEENLDGPVVFKDASGYPKMTIPQRLYWDLVLIEESQGQNGRNGRGEKP